MRKTSDAGGILAMVAATGIFVAGDSIMKVVTESLPPFEVLSLRGVTASIACAALVALRGEGRLVLGALDSRALLRAGAEAMSSLCYVVALALTPIADVIAILQTAPLITILGAVLVFREKIGLARLTLALVGFAGALMVAQPGPHGFSPAALLVFGSAFFIAARDLVGRGVSSQIPAAVVILATVIMVMVTAGAVSFHQETWVTPTTHHVLMLAFAGTFLALGHVALLLAYRLGKAAAVAPFFYSFALWGVISGLAIWHELPNTLALSGIAVIVASGVANILLDRHKGRAAEIKAAL